ncbi:5255_t:CDS:2 [Scutellospora calospora]|uniref:5255_t:CDS:1 n=1 Tax=Scutellospora calospora TaxID=85575 RepID=A0ACA9K6R9_9GLOM|nr:5255_t:CDS:2 [Scutellospora calospora]
MCSHISNKQKKEIYEFTKKNLSYKYYEIANKFMKHYLNLKIDHLTISKILKKADEYNQIQDDDIEVQDNNEDKLLSKNDPNNKIEELRKSHKKGHKEGHKKGYKEGYMEGYKKGHKKGYKKGYEKDYREGYKEDPREYLIEIN